MKGSQESLTTVVVKDAANWPTPNCMDVITPNRDLTQMESKGHWGKGMNTGKLSEMVNYGLPAPANPSTDGSRPESWVTPRTSGTSTRPNKTSPRQGLCLIEQVREQEIKGTNPKQESGAVKCWGTPTARDHKSGRGNEERQYKELTPMVERTQAGKLNPRWVETLMGLPVGWTMPSCASPVTTVPTNFGCLETESCQQQQREHSELF